WCGQVKVDSYKTEEDLKPVRQDIMVDGAKGIFVELVGNGKTILGVIVTKDGQQWVIKLMGDNDLAKREKANFTTFVQSLKF
ncbi:MAG: hypothetical protein IH991_22500, partial [Planctomycetes bacterium]|nr:hypothetical protein [Planctomycetota bacterium]